MIILRGQVVPEGMGVLPRPPDRSGLLALQEIAVIATPGEVVPDGEALTRALEWAESLASFPHTGVAQYVTACPAVFHRPSNNRP